MRLERGRSVSFVGLLTISSGTDCHQFCGHVGRVSIDLNPVGDGVRAIFCRASRWDGS